MKMMERTVGKALKKLVGVTISICVAAAVLPGCSGVEWFPESTTSTATAPTVTAFTMPPTSTSLTVNVSSFTASGSTGYQITESATAPDAAGSGWSTTPPTSFTFSSAGSKTAYAWAKNAAGKVSTSLSAPVTITLPPTISVFTMNSTATSRVAVPIKTLETSSDAKEFLVTKTPVTPAAAASWSTTKPGFVNFSSIGRVTAYAWAKNGAAISASKSATVRITEAPSATTPAVVDFIMPATAASLTVPITKFAASAGTTHFLVTESGTPPSDADNRWAATAPTSFTFAGEGARSAYAWVKSGTVVSQNGFRAPVTIAIPVTDTTGKVSVSVSASQNINEKWFLNFTFNNTDTSPVTLAITVSAFDLADNAIIITPATSNVANIPVGTSTRLVDVTVAGWPVNIASWKITNIIKQ